MKPKRSHYSHLWERQLFPNKLKTNNFLTCSFLLKVFFLIIVSQWRLKMYVRENSISPLVFVVLKQIWEWVMFMIHLSSIMWLLKLCITLLLLRLFYTHNLLNLYTHYILIFILLLRIFVFILGNAYKVVYREKQNALQKHPRGH